MNEQPERKDFTFKIALSVLNHLGRNLYRSFVTVLGEAISNSWDADAEHVWLYIDRDNGNFFIKDDGIGMSAEEFQGKFLKIGYSKRKEGNISPGKERPYIGRKGIGKLALLSCAQIITVISKKHGRNYIGGVIDNSGLDEAITDDLLPEEYPLGVPNMATFRKYTKKHKKGTIIYFENINEEIKHTPEFYKKVMALYFRFSLLDKDFRMFINEDEITLDCLRDLVLKTQFLWRINDLHDPYIDMLQEKFTSDKNEEKQLTPTMNIKGFIASVEKPLNLKIFTTDERVGVDLFVNGRLRERGILGHIPTARVVESYLYGQIHFDELDDKEDRFASGREGIRAGDLKFQKLLDLLRDEIIPTILDDWDDWRRKHKKKGDPERLTITPKERAAEELYFEVAKDYELPKGSENKKKVDGWVDDLSDDASFNFASYGDCFVSENLIRKFIDEKNIDYSDYKARIDGFKETEAKSKVKGNLNIDLRQRASDLNHLEMGELAELADKRGFTNCLDNDAKQYKPIRDALMHTARLTGEAKLKLRTVYDNIKGRIMTLLVGKSRKPSGKK